MISLGGG